LSFYQLRHLHQYQDNLLMKLDQPHWTLIIFICYTISISIRTSIQCCSSNIWARICTILYSISISIRTSVEFF
jgi:hypothetical protein